MPWSARAGRCGSAFRGIPGVSRPSCGGGTGAACLRPSSHSASRLQGRFHAGRGSSTGVRRLGIARLSCSDVASSRSPGSVPPGAGVSQGACSVTCVTGRGWRYLRLFAQRDARFGGAAVAAQVADVAWGWRVELVKACVSCCERIRVIRTLRSVKKVCAGVAHLARCKRHRERRA